MIYLQLFLSFLQIGLFSFGGGLCGNALDSGAGGYSTWVAQACLNLQILSPFPR